MPAKTRKLAGSAPLNTWQEITVVISGTKITGTVNDGSLHVEHALEAPVRGRVGLWAKRDSVSASKDLRAEPLRTSRQQ